jgi:hypothetical protein
MKIINNNNNNINPNTTMKTDQQDEVIEGKIEGRGMDGRPKR